MKKLKKLRLSRETLHKLSLDESGLHHAAGGATNAATCPATCAKTCVSCDPCGSKGSMIVACND
jgi:hypothetical protein